MRSTILAIICIMTWLVIVGSCPGEINNAAMLEDACKYYRALRTDNGFYLDSYILSSRHMRRNHVVSSATTGIGLVSLCIESKCGFSDDAETLALETLRLLNGKAKIKPARNPNGLFNHFIDARTGKSDRKAYFSTIDTALLVSGAIFCRNTFSHNREIVSEVDELWNSVNWVSCRIDGMHYYLTQNEKGEGNGRTRLFNEYIILADYCAIASGDKPPEIDSKWIRHKSGSYLVLSDVAHRALPLFTFQFPLYLSPVRSASKQFYLECAEAIKADKAWWQEQTKQEGVWGSSAGASVQGYAVNITGSNEGMIVNAPSVAGFMSFSAICRDDFRNMLRKYPQLMQGPGEWKVPWRISLEDPEWRPWSIQGIDLSPALFGLASMDSRVGLSFFQENSKCSPAASRGDAAQ